MLSLRDAFDEQHGCRPDEDVPAEVCRAMVDGGALPAGRAFCTHTYCKTALGRDAARLVRSPARFMSHRSFPPRFAAAELVASLCAHLATMLNLLGRWAFVCSTTSRWRQSGRGARTY